MTLTPAQLSAIAAQPGYGVDDDDMPMPEAPKRHKYGAVATEVDGITFHSKAEATRYLELQTLEQAAEIFNLELQPVYELIVNGFKVAEYRGDFRYIDGEGNTITEDVKGVQTAVYRLKKKLVKALYGIEIKEVT